MARLSIAFLSLCFFLLGIEAFWVDKKSQNGIRKRPPKVSWRHLASNMGLDPTYPNSPSWDRASLLTKKRLGITSLERLCRRRPWHSRCTPNPNLDRCIPSEATNWCEDWVPPTEPDPNDCIPSEETNWCVDWVPPTESNPYECIPSAANNWCEDSGPQFKPRMLLTRRRYKISSLARLCRQRPWHSRCKPNPNPDDCIPSEATNWCEDWVPQTEPNSNECIPSAANNWCEDSGHMRWRTSGRDLLGGRCRGSNCWGK